MRSLVVCGDLLLAMIGADNAFADAEPTAQGKKLIKLYGKDKTSTAYLKAHVAEIELLALDGIYIVAHTNEPKDGDWQGADGNYLWFTSIPVKREDFTRAVADLNETKFNRLHFNFLQFAARGPANADWFDDDAWEVVNANVRVAGWVVAQTRLVSSPGPRCTTTPCRPIRWRKDTARWSGIDGPLRSVALLRYATDSGSVWTKALIWSRTRR